MAGIAVFVVAGAVLFTAALAAVRRLTGGATRATVLLLSPLLLLMPWSLLPARAPLAWPPALAGVAAGLVVFTLLADPGSRAPVRQTTD